MAKTLGKFLVVFLAAYSWCGCASAYDCPPYAEPRIIITPYFNGPAFDNSLSMRELKLSAMNDGIMTEEQAALRTKEHARVGGLTVQKPTVSNVAKIKTRRLPDNSICAQVAELRLSLKVRHPIVYIAREFPVNSCSYNAVLQHEMKHVAAARSFLNAFPSIAEQHLGEFLRRLSVIHAGKSLTDGNVQQAIEQKLKIYLSSFETELLGALSLMESRIDSPEEYERISTSCGGETQAIFDAAAD